jgi:hypothetical protein
MQKSVVTVSFDMLFIYLLIYGLLDHPLNASNYIATNNDTIINEQWIWKEADTLEVLPRILDEKTVKQWLLHFVRRKLQ